MNPIRRLAIAALRSELTEREEAARRKLADQAYQGKGGAGRRGRAWWDGYAHAIRALREKEGHL